MVELLQEASSVRAQMAKSLAQQQKYNINALHSELSHPSEAITRATGRDMGLNLTGIF